MIHDEIFGGWELFCVECEIEPLLISDEVDLCAECRALHPEMLLEDRK